MEDADIMATNPVTAVKEDVDYKTTRIGAEGVVVEPTVILHINFGHTECVPIQANIAGPERMATIRTQYVVMRCRSVRETSPDSPGQYLLIKLM